MQSINWYGLRALFSKEVHRFMKVYNQTLFAPMVNALLFLAIFNLALSDRVDTIQGVPFSHFMVPGLIMMTMIQNAFANSSSSLIMGKVLGSIIDLLMPPLNAVEITIAMVGAGIMRGLATGLLVALGISLFVPFGIHNIWLLVCYAVLACMAMALLGMMGGILADSFDQMSAITSYVITPLSFLSGTFYSIQQLPDFWQQVNLANPFFYMVDGFRYSLTGYHDGDLTFGLSYLIFANIILLIIVYQMIERGYRIKT